MCRFKNLPILKNRYVVYFLVLILLSILSILPFLVTIYRVFSKNYILLTIILCMFLQTLVHIKFFLHLDFSFKNRWRVISLVFSIIVGIIILFGSIWIMKNLNHNLCVT